MNRSFSLSIVLSSSILALALAGCGGGGGAEPAKTAEAAGHHEHGPGGHHEHGDHAHAAAGTVKAPGDAKVGDTTTCPVSGEEFVVTETSPKVEYNGKTYFTCCAGCKKKFESDPAKFLKPST